MVGIFLMLAFHLFFKIGESYFAHRETKDKVSDSSIAHLTKAVEELKLSISQLPKFQKDVQRFYTAIKLLAGDDWPAIRDEILEEDRLKNGGK